ncbi:MAG: type III pantothenate kinase [Verrucomicrobiota bacterium]
MSADFLLIDHSNTRTKLALGDCQQLHRRPRARLPTREVSPAALERAVEGWDFAAVAIASVVPAQRSAFWEAFGAYPLHFVSHQSELQIAIDYPEPARIGADRLANAEAAHQEEGAPCIAIDFGTAVTFDILDARPAYVGGVIAPGLDLMTDYLHERTALLPQVELQSPSRAIGKSTEEAICSGAVFGYRGLIREIVREIQNELGLRQPCPLLATGGYARLLEPQLPEMDRILPDLTLEGIRRIATLNLT